MRCIFLFLRLTGFLLFGRNLSAFQKNKKPTLKAGGDAAAIVNAGKKPVNTF
jgi:hypothetical protein